MVKKIEQIMNLSRWALLLVFVIGYLVSKTYFSFASFEYFIYNLLALGACAILLNQLKSFEYRYMAAWLVLIIIITVYFLRLYWIALDPTPVQVMLPWNPYQNMLLKKDLFLYAFKLSTVMFASFCVVCAWLLNYLRDYNFKKLSLKHEDLRVHKLSEKVLLIILPPIMLSLYFLTYYYQIGFMGASSGEPLPFRLKGIVFYASVVFVPLLIALLIYAAEQCEHKLMSSFGILLMIVHGVALMLLRGSRSSLLLSILLLAFLVMAGGLKLQRNQKIFIGIFVLGAFFMVPVMTIYRNLRVEQGMLLFEAITHALYLAQNDLAGTFLKGIKFVLFRMPGIESLWCMLAQGVTPLGTRIFDVFASLNGVAGHLTYNIYPLKPEHNTLLAPSFVGWFYLVAGLPAVAIGGVLAALLSVIGWVVTSRNYLKCGLIAQTFLLWMLFVALTEGTLDTMGLLVFSGIACITIIELTLILFSAFLYKKSSS